MTYKIERGFPIPLAARQEKYPLLDLEIGDSFLVPNEKRDLVYRAAYMCGRRHDRRFKCKTMSTGIRVWRIA